tara:strand:- start:3636 stop:4946 length:1311 start_codon:yes stop_codon:yes gene_type:complete
MSWLLLCSFWFYAQWRTADLALLVTIILINYVAAMKLRALGVSRTLFGVIFINLGVLAFFKYWPWVDWDIDRSLLLAGLPLGISFYVFQAIAFQVDFSRGITKLPKPLDFALFLGFFPQLIAGPIVHGRELFPQLSKLGARPCLISLGLTLFSVGLAKKVLIADSLAGGVDAIYLKTQNIDVTTTIAAGVGYGAQLYFDFSGYADMAVGLGLLFGIRLPQNFRSPYSASSISDFWKSWHITLSRFLKDYLYIPLGGNRLGSLRKCINLLVTMILGGLWHGAGLQFVIWGFAHGVFLVVEYVGRTQLGWLADLIPLFIRRVLTFAIVMLLWIPFRAADLNQAEQLITGLLHWSMPNVPSMIEIFEPLMKLSSSSSPPIVVLFWAFLSIYLISCCPTAFRWSLGAGGFKRGMTFALLTLMVIKTLADRPDQPFLYFQF